MLSTLQQLMALFYSVFLVNGKLRVFAAFYLMSREGWLAIRLTVLKPCGFIVHLVRFQRVAVGMF